MTNREFQPLGFACAYQCDGDPEFPGDGVWKETTYEFKKDEDSPFKSNWATPYVLRVAPQDFPAWVGFFEAGGFGPDEGAYGTPSPHRLCLVANGLAYVVDVRQPSRYGRVYDNVVEVLGSPEHKVLVLSSWSELCVIDADGRAVRSPRLCADDLRLEDITSAGIVCTGDFIRAREKVVVDPVTAEITEGPKFRWNLK